MRYKREYQHLAFEVYKNAKICTKCWTTEQIQVHHKDKDHSNNLEENLQVLCNSCHQSLHNNFNAAVNNKWRIPHNKWKKMDAEFRKKVSKGKKWRKPWNYNKGKTIDWLWYTAWRESTWGTRKEFYTLAK